ncbi:hypothetical protein [Herminiimonas aquatilis]|uniref:Uncharacterized protein n=1 Tax=Herminiimonas aquatilis TaxID=345342 RepID=A0ABW2J0U8_9BURK
MSKATYDLELALTDPSKLTDSLMATLRTKFVLEDRSEQGWGLVLRLQKTEENSLAALAENFVSAAIKFKSAIKNSKPILRVAAFNSNATCTLLFKDIESLAELGVQLEVSVYPTDN